MAMESLLTDYKFLCRKREEVRVLLSVVVQYPSPHCIQIDNATIQMLWIQAL